jgi:hypothetical protein
MAQLTKAQLRAVSVILTRLKGIPSVLAAVLYAQDHGQISAVGSLTSSIAKELIKLAPKVYYELDLREDMVGKVEVLRDAQTAVCFERLGPNHLLAVVIDSKERFFTVMQSFDAVAVGVELEGIIGIGPASSRSKPRSSGPTGSPPKTGLPAEVFADLAKPK